MAIRSVHYSRPWGVGAICLPLEMPEVRGLPPAAPWVEVADGVRLRVEGAGICAGAVKAGRGRWVAEGGRLALVSMDRPAKEPWGYFITFTCYGVRLHGDSRGSVDREHSGHGGPYAPEDHGRVDVARRSMSDDSVSLKDEERRVVLDEIVSSCTRHGWTLHVVHVRSTHVHLVVSAGVEPEIVMGRLKAFASRTLNERFGKREKRWARHGSTRWLFDPRGVQGAVDYVVRGQGEPMSLYVNPQAWEEYWGG